MEETIKLKCSYCCETFDREKLYIIDINHRLPPEPATGTIYLCPHCYQLLKEYMTTENPNYIIPSGKTIIEQEDIEDTIDNLEQALDILDDYTSMSLNNEHYRAWYSGDAADMYNNVKMAYDIMRDVRDKSETNN